MLNFNINITLIVKLISSIISMFWSWTRLFTIYNLQFLFIQLKRNRIEKNINFDLFQSTFSKLLNSWNNNCCLQYNSMSRTAGWTIIWERMWPAWGTLNWWLDSLSWTESGTRKSRWGSWLFWQKIFGLVCLGLTSNLTHVQLSSVTRKSNFPCLVFFYNYFFITTSRMI